MAAETVADAFEICPNSTEKTNLIAAYEAVQTNITAARVAGAFSTNVEDQLNSEVVDQAETTAACMRDHT